MAKKKNKIPKVKPDSYKDKMIEKVAKAKASKGKKVAAKKCA